MLELPRTQVQTHAAEIPSVRPRFSIKAGFVVPLLFILFGAWGLMLAFPSFRAMSYGLELTDLISVQDHGKPVLRSIWQAALPGFALAIMGVLGAVWAYHQYRLPEPDLPQSS